MISSASHTLLLLDHRLSGEYNLYMWEDQYLDRMDGSGYDGRRFPLTGSFLEVLYKLKIIGIILKTHTYCSLPKEWP